MRLMRSLLVLLTLSGVAQAQVPLAADQIKMTPRASSSCAPGLVCLFMNESERLKVRKADGTVGDPQASSGGGGGSNTCSSPIVCTDGSTFTHAASGITAGSYGSASSVPVCSYSATGHATTCSSTAISIPASAVASGNLACGRLPALTGDVSTSAGSCSVTVGALQGQTVSNATPSSNQALLYSGGAWGPGTIGQSNVANGYVALSGAQTVAGVKTFSSVPKADGLTATGANGLVLTDNVTDTGDFATTEPHLTLRLTQPITTTGIDVCIKARSLDGANPEGCLISLDHTSASSILELNAADFTAVPPQIQYGGSIQSFWQGGSSMFQFNNYRKVVPDWNGDDGLGASPYWAGHHYGTVLGTHAIAGEVDDRLWRSVAAFIHDTNAPAITCSGDVTFNPVRQGSAATCTSSGNVTSFTIALPDDGSGRVIDGFQVAFRFKQGNAGHTWATTITNATLPAGVTSMKPSRTLNGVDYLLCTYFAAASVYQCNVASDSQIWQPYGKLLTKALGTSISGAGSGQDGYCVRWNNSAAEYQLSSCPGAGGGASITLTGTTELGVSGSPGDTLALAWSSASGRKFIASPADGTSGAYAGRAIVAADIPDLSGTYQPLDSDLTALAALASTAGMVSRTGAGAFAARTLACSNATCSWTNGDGSAGAPTLALNVGTGANSLCAGNDTRLPPSPGSAGCVLQSNGSAYVCTGPGTSGYVWTSNGAGLASWQAAGGAPSGSAGGDLGGTYPNPVVTGIRGTPVDSGTPLAGDVICGVDIGGGVIHYQPCAQNIAAPGADGGWLYSSSGTWARHAACSAGQYIRGNGAASPTCSSIVSGDLPDLSSTYQPTDADLTALAALASTAGMVSRTGAGAFAVRTFACGSSTCSWSNGDGASGAPTVTIANTTINGATCTPGSSCAARTFTEAGRVRQNNSADSFYTEFTSAATANRTWTLPDATDTACGITATQTLTNKTLTTPTIASFNNANHSHTNSTGGGQLNASSVFASGAVPALNGGLATDASGFTGILHAASGVFTAAAVNLATEVTGTLGIASLDKASATGWTADHSWTGSAATGVTTTQNSPFLNLIGAYWNGSASTAFKMSMRFIVSATTPAGRIAFFDNSGTEQASVDYLGVIAAAKFVGTLGASAANQNTVPSVNGDTFAMVAASQTLTNKTLTTPTIASFTNATHTHQNAAGGGTLDAAAIAAGILPIARGGRNSGAALGNGLGMVSEGGAIVEGRFVDQYKSCTSTTTGGALVDCDFPVALPNGIGGHSAKAFKGTITVSIASNGAGGGTVALTCGTSHGGTDVLLSQTLTAGTTPVGTPYGDKGDGSELGTKADSTRSYNLYIDGGTTVSCRLAAPSGTVSGAISVDMLLSGQRL